MTDNLPFGIDAAQLIVAMAGLSAVVAVLLVWTALLPKSQGVVRARSILERQNELKRVTAQPRGRQQLVRVLGVMRKVVDRLQLMRSKQAEKISGKLAQAGIRTSDAKVAYLFAKTTLPLAAGLAAAFLLFVAEVYNGSQMMRLMMALTAVLLSAYAPDIYIKNRADKRRTNLRKGLPDALDLMVICAEAGLSLDATFQRVSGELHSTYPDLADELALTSVELSFLPERRLALEGLAARTDLPGLRGMVNTLMQTERYGTPLAQSLRVLASELRTERLMRAEEKAARLPAILTVPLIIFILPPLFIVLLGPAILSTMDALRGLKL